VTSHTDLGRPGMITVGSVSAAAEARSLSEIIGAGAPEPPSAPDYDSSQLAPADRAALAAAPLQVKRGLQPLLPPAVPGWNISARPLSWGGLHRYYLVARPESVPAGARLPVLVVLHGHGMIPASIERLTHFLQTAGDAVVVYPAGYYSSWDAGYCCGVAARAGTDDVGFLEAVIRQVLRSQPGTSAHHVFLAGYSNGGRMAYRMACQDQGAFAAVAAVEAVPVYDCFHTRPVSLLVVASTADPLVTVYNDQLAKQVNGHVEMTVADAVAQWRQLDGCQTAHTHSYQGVLSVDTWSHCRAGVRVELAVVPGGSHAWYQGAPGTPSAQQLIWHFFSGPAAR
jgi:polyhydroxybutyrate depolymerase